MSSVKQNGYTRLAELVKRIIKRLKHKNCLWSLKKNHIIGFVENKKNFSQHVGRHDARATRISRRPYCDTVKTFDFRTISSVSDSNKPNVKYIFRKRVTKKTAVERTRAKRVSRRSVFASVERVIVYASGGRAAFRSLAFYTYLYVYDFYDPPAIKKIAAAAAAASLRVFNPSEWYRKIFSILRDYRANNNWEPNSIEIVFRNDKISHCFYGATSIINLSR